jgi:hypothetical protein
MKLTPDQEEEYFQRALKEYPVGTAIYHMGTDGDTDTSSIVSIGFGPVCHHKGNDIFNIEGGPGYIYIRGKWATKVLSAGVTKDNYLIIS